MVINFKRLLSITSGCFWALSVFAGSEPEIIEDGNGEPIAIRLNLPEELVKDCESDFWALKDEETKTDLDNVLRSQESFDEWCKAQTKIDNRNPVEMRDLLCKYAYILRCANEKAYVLDGKFCKRMELGRILGSIHLKGATPCCCCSYTESEKYISCLKCVLEYGF